MRHAVVPVLPLVLLLVASSWAASSLAASAIDDDTEVSTLERELLSVGFTGFVNLLNQAGLMSELELRARAGSAMSVFVPTNDALMRADPALLAFLKMPRNDAMLRDVLFYHVIEKPVSAFSWEGSYATLQGSTIELHVDALAFQVGDSTVKQYNALTLSLGLGSSDDAAVGSLVVHSISSLLVPPSLEETLSTTDLNAFLTENGGLIGNDGRGFHAVDGRRAMLDATAAPPSTPPVSSPPPPSPIVPSPSPPPQTPPPPPKSAPGTLSLGQFLPSLAFALVAVVALF